MPRRFYPLSAILLCILFSLCDTALAQTADDGIQLYLPDTLDVTLGQACIDALATKIDCPGFVQTFTELRYRQSLQNVTLTDEICTTACSESLRSWFRSVETSCAGKTVGGGGGGGGGYPTRYGGYMWAGWNETCVRDPRTRLYCNDVMFNFTAVSDVGEMPRDELCHTCNVRRLSMMQASQYSIYDEFWQSQLEYVYAECDGVGGPTEIPPPLEEEEAPAPTTPYCVTNKRYTTQAGDTCESIANASSVSAAALYMGNQALLPACDDVPPGVTLCLPLTCQTYYVRPSDTCVGIEASLGLNHPLGGGGGLRSYNSWIDALCTNLQDATDFYGKLICASPQGGHFTGTVAPPAPTALPAPDDGYALSPVAPPAGVPVAEGTTLNCGRWHVVVVVEEEEEEEEAGDTCTTICVRNGIAAALFHAVNPSLGAEAACTQSLVPGTALCVGPTYGWNSTAATTTITGDLSDMTAAAVPSSTR